MDDLSERQMMLVGYIIIVIIAIGLGFNLLWLIIGLIVKIVEAIRSLSKAKKN